MSVLQQEKREILPDNVVPSHYSITLEPDLVSLKYVGSVAIDLEVQRDSDFITVNIKDMKISSVKLKVNGDVLGRKPKLKYDEKLERVTFLYDSDLLKKGDRATLFLRFGRDLGQSPVGLFLSAYETRSGRTKYVVVTQHEPVDARRTFPCFDEPALKATFTVTLIASPDLVCLSNMDVDREYQTISSFSAETLKAVKFNKSPKMSTYLLAVAIGELEYIESNDFRVPIRVWATPNEKVEDGRFSLEVAAKTLGFFEKQFQYAYPLPKMDQLAVTNFGGGMENWGLIVYTANILLNNPDTTGIENQSVYGGVVVHENAHQHFGNLVTAKWWDSIWLNEGFASWSTGWAAESLFPEWNATKNFVSGVLNTILTTDALRGSHAIERPVSRPKQINEAFDDITYNKGRAVIQMAFNYLSEAVFVKGMQLYFKKYAFGNADSDDLWKAHEEVSGRPISEMMNIWTRRIGFPVVTVTESKNKICVEQHRFLASGKPTEEEDSILYPVPIGLRTRQGVQTDLLLTDRKMEVEVDIEEFVKINADHASFFRTAYTPSRLLKIRDSARAGLLSVEDRCGILHDTIALASANYYKTSSFLELLSGLEEESSYFVWNTALNALQLVLDAWKADPDGAEAFKAYMRSLIKPMICKKGWQVHDQDSGEERKLKQLLFTFAAQVGDKDILTASKRMFAKYMAGDRKAIPVDLRGAVYAVVMEHGGRDEFDALITEYNTSTSQTLRQTALRSLGWVREPELIEHILDFLLTSAQLHVEDFQLPLPALSKSRVSAEIMWKWTQEHYDELLPKIPTNLLTRANFVEKCTLGLTKDKDADEVEAFFKSKDQSGFEKKLLQSVEKIRIAAAWHARDKDDVQQYIDNGWILV